jgi:hypothetical protein
LDDEVRPRRGQRLDVRHEVLPGDIRPNLGGLGEYLAEDALEDRTLGDPVHPGETLGSLAHSDDDGGHRDRDRGNAFGRLFQPHRPPLQVGE